MSWYLRPDKARKVFSYLRVLASVALLARNGSSKMNFFKKASKKKTTNSSHWKKQVKWSFTYLLHFFKSQISDTIKSSPIPFTLGKLAKITRSKVRVVFVHLIFIQYWKLKIKTSQSWLAMFDPQKLKIKNLQSQFSMFVAKKGKIEHPTSIFNG